MNRQILRPVLIGLLIGAGLYFMPFFILRVALLILIAGLILRLVFGRGRFGRGFPERRLQMADRIRNMSDEEYARFKERAATYGCGGRKGFNNPQNEQHEK